MNDQFTPLDNELAKLIQNLDPSNAEILSPLVRELSHTIRNGGVCLKLSNRNELLPLIRNSAAVSSSSANKPLVLDNNNLLYFARYYTYEKLLAEKLLSLSAENCLPTISFAVDSNASPQQVSAIKTALSQRLTIISGGPGTGKTWTAAQIISALQKAGQSSAVAAPTGKAANRLMQSLSSIAQQQKASTIHRLLGISYSSIPKYNASTPLPFDAIIIDEASMIDLSLMFHLVNAIGKNSRLILIGDHYQLASVEAGSVFSDICSSANFKDSPLSKCLIELSITHRFSHDSIIAKTAKLVKEGNAHESLAILKNNNCFHANTPISDFYKKLLTECETWFSSYINSLDNPSIALQNLKRLKVLTPVHHGKLGINEINSQFINFISKKTYGETGLPILIHNNNIEIELYNGDTGIILKNNNNSEYSAFFESANNELRQIPLSRISQYSPAFALTIHKSQGSEYDTIHLVLPESTDSKILCRELIYTAITRARKNIVVWGSEEVWLSAVSEPNKRISGLSQRLNSASNK